MDNHFEFYHKEKARLKSNWGGRGDQGKSVCFLIRWGDVACLFAYDNNPIERGKR